MVCSSREITRLVVDAQYSTVQSHPTHYQGSLNPKNLSSPVSEPLALGACNDPPMIKFGFQGENSQLAKLHT